MSYYDPDGWGTPLIVIVLGLSLITFPFYVRVRVHMRMSDEAFAQVPRGALWAQSIGIWNLVFLGLILLIFVQDHPDSERYATMSLILGIVILHLMARLLQSIALGSRWRRLQRGQRWQPAPVTQYILAYPAVFVPGAGQPIAPPSSHHRPWKVEDSMPGLTRCLLFRPALPPPLSSRFWTPCTGKLPKPTHGLLLWKRSCPKHAGT